MPDSAKFCVACGTKVPGAAAGTEQAQEPQAAPQTPPVQAAYTPPQSSYQTAANSYNPGQSYAPQPAYAAPAAKPKGKSTLALLVTLVGSLLVIAGFFLPLVNAMGTSVSLMDLSFGTGVVGSFNIEQLPYAAFLLAGVLGLLFALTKPKLALISVLLGVGGYVYIFLTSNGLNVDFFFKYGDVGFYLTDAGIVVLLIGSILGFRRR
jgi:hypothetical protein